jgi:hypothetical protein
MVPSMFRTFLPLGMLFLGSSSTGATNSMPEANYDEEKAWGSILPDPLQPLTGGRVLNAVEWERARRPEILRLFEEHVYGVRPQNALQARIRIAVLAREPGALQGRATRYRIRLDVPEAPRWAGLEMLAYVPAQATAPAPFFLGLNFEGNHAVTSEIDVPLNAGRIRDARWRPPRNGVPSDWEKSRGSEYSRWLPEELMDAGVGLVTAYYGDIEPDWAEGWKTGIRGALSPDAEETKWRRNDWGAISAWAWGLSRMLDVIPAIPGLDSGRCAVIGHSRLGKTALWAGATDSRFSVVISNDSGEGGAALMRRNYGENLATITRRFPHWFAGGLAQYAGREKDLPTDQHLLVALMAPRPVAIGSAEEDRWADPRGEYLSGWHAGAVYGLYGKKGVPGPEWPGLGVCGDWVQYHLRAGIHDLTREDWGHYLAFCKRHWGMR